ncbi:MAG: pilus assembly protein TadG-related protein [Candidatus Dormibacteria bacterium]
MTAESHRPQPARSNGERGQILPLFCLILALLLLPVAGLAVDGGLLLSDHATLVGAAQGAAEAAAQAVDVTALEKSGSFDLCATADGGPSCGNGVGDVGTVVAEVLDSGDPSLPDACRDQGGAPLPARPGGAQGCAFRLLASVCPGAAGMGATGSGWQGVEVRAWRTVRLPLLAFASWGSVRITAQATAFMEHGFGSESLTLAPGGPGC